MPTFTPTYGLSLPLVNDPSDEDLWGNELNADVTSIDGLMKTAINWTPTPQTASFSVTAPTAASTATGSSCLLYLCDATAGAIVPTLPAASTCSGMKVAFKKTDVSVFAVTITPVGADKIDGVSTLALSSQYSYVVLASDGTNWNIVGGSAAATTTQAGIVRLATTAEAAGTSSTVSLTPSSVAGNQLLATRGYQTFPGGLTLQWGQDSVSADPTMITFPIPFNGQAFSCVASVYGDPSGFQDVVEIRGLTFLNFYATIVGGSGGAYSSTICWQAIGKV